MAFTRFVIFVSLLGGCLGSEQFFIPTGKVATIECSATCDLCEIKISSGSKTVGQGVSRATASGVSDSSFVCEISDKNPHKNATAEIKVKFDNAPQNFENRSWRKGNKKFSFEFSEGKIVQKIQFPLMNNVDHEEISFNLTDNFIIQAESDEYWTPEEGEKVESTFFVLGNRRPNISFGFMKCEKVLSWPTCTTKAGDKASEFENPMTPDQKQLSKYMWSYTFDLTVTSPVFLIARLTDSFSVDQQFTEIKIGEKYGSIKVVSGAAWDEESKTFKAFENERVVFVCERHIYDKAHGVYWMKNGTMLFPQDLPKGINTTKINITDIEGKYSSKSYLTFENFSNSEADQYTCEIESSGYIDKFSDPEHSYFVLHGFSVAAMKKEPEIIKFELTNDNLTVQCLINGQTPIFVTILRNGEECFKNSNSTFENGTVVITASGNCKNEGGDYQCFANNEHGRKETEILHVNAPLNIKTFLIAAVIILLVLFVLSSAVYYRKTYQLRKKYEEKLGLLPHSSGRINPNMILNDQTDYLPYDRKYEIPEREFGMKEQLGEGNFGKVFLAMRGDRYVAVKFIKFTSEDIENAKAVVSELKIMIAIGKHPNIVNLIGAVTENLHKGEMKIVVEYCRFGNIRDILRRNKIREQAERVKDEAHESIEMQPLISTDFETLCCWAYQIADGMNHISSKNVIHGDLAARNVLLAEDSPQPVVKICDFGLSKNLITRDYYRRNENAKMPLKWLAPECLYDSKYSKESDVWSYGVLLWEMFTDGATPFADIEDSNQLYEKLCRGARLNQPEKADNEVYRIMLSCWEFDPEKRPSFSNLRSDFGMLISTRFDGKYAIPNMHLQSDQPRAEGYAPIGTATKDFSRRNNSDDSGFENNSQ